MYNLRRFIALFITAVIAIVALVILVKFLTVVFMLALIVALIAFAYYWFTRANESRRRNRNW